MRTHDDHRPVRVLHVVGDSKFGGVATIIEGLARMSRAEGWEVDVLATDPVFQKFAREHGMGIVDMDVIRRPIRPFWDLAGLLRMRRFLESHDYRIVHTHTSKGGFVGRLAAWLAGVRVIVHTVHGFAFHEASPQPTLRFYTWLEKMAARWCDRITAVSEFHRDWALRLNICPPSRIVAIPNGIADRFRAPAGGAAALRGQLGAAEDDVVVLSLARLAWDKGLEYLIRAAAMLPYTERRIHVVIAGDGPIRDSLEKLATLLGVTGRVTFLGFRSDVANLLAAADVVVVPSLREGLSISLLEAMAAGKGIIASSIGSQREVASQAECVRLVPPGNAVALRDAIAEIVHWPEIASRLGRRARALYESRYTEERMLGGYRELYLDLLKEKCAESGERRGAVGTQLVVRPAVAQDLAAIVAIHRRAFSDFFLTRLGSAFLDRYYRLVLQFRHGILLVSESGGAITGFVSGFVDPAGFYRFMWSNRWGFVWPVMQAVARHPSLAANVAHSVQRIQTTASEWPDGSCELSSIAVAPAVTGNGVGSALMKAFLDEAASRQACAVYLTTDAEDNPHANELYRRAGFQQVRRFLQRKGRWMNEYVIDSLRSEENCEAGT